jgi:membrane associated rhomboid family serine protease
MLPLFDDNPHELRPYVTWGIIAVCVIVFLGQALLDDPTYEVIVLGAALIPARLFGYAALPPDFPALPAWFTPISSMFMHGDWLHIGGNMLYLWIFGDNVEDALGHARYLAFYLACGIVAALSQTLLAPDSTIPIIGASGAISGVLGAYLLLYPRANVRTLVFVVVFVTVIRIPAAIVLGLWFILQLADAAFSNPAEPGVAFWAHVGGFVTGALLVLILRRPGFDLWQGARSRAFEAARPRGPWS